MSQRESKDDLGLRVCSRGFLGFRVCSIFVLGKTLRNMFSDVIVSRMLLDLSVLDDFFCKGHSIVCFMVH